LYILTELLKYSMYWSLNLKFYVLTCCIPTAILNNSSIFEWPQISQIFHPLWNSIEFKHILFVMWIIVIRESYIPRYKNKANLFPVEYFYVLGWLLRVTQYSRQGHKHIQNNAVSGILKLPTEIAIYSLFLMLLR